MQKEDYLEIQSQFIDLFDSEPKQEIKQVDIEARLAEIKFEETDEFKDYFIQNSTRQTIRNYILSLGNQLNLYPVRILKLKAWNHLFEKRQSEDEKIFILQDRIIPFSTLLLTEPNVIKNRIAFFYFSSLKGEFKISNFKSDETYSVEQINSDFYKSKADNYNYDLSKINDLLWNINTDKIKEFRDNYTHKIASNIGIGHFNEIETSSQGGMSAVLFKTQSPIGVNEVIDLAKSETDSLFAAFEELMNFFKQVSNYS